MRTSVSLLAKIVLVAGVASASVAQEVGHLTVEGTEFVLSRGTASTLRSAALIGAVLKMRLDGRDASMRIDAVISDREAVGGAVWLHDFQVRYADGNWRPLCRPDIKGKTLGIPLPDGRGGFTLTCTSGAEAKCVRFGYRSWMTMSDGTPLRDVHRACIHMVRADYGGDDRPSTRDGTVIDIFDPWGIQKADNSPEQAFEAGWGPDGAVCVHHPRIAKNITLAALEDRYPHLRGRTGTVCTEVFALAHGALVMNRSTP